MRKIEVKLECILENQNEDRNLLRQTVASLLPTGASQTADAPVGSRLATVCLNVLPKLV